MYGSGLTFGFANTVTRFLPIAKFITISTFRLFGFTRWELGVAIKNMKRKLLVLDRFVTPILTWTFDRQGAVVMAQFVERLLPTPEINSSNPVISNIIYHNCIKNCVIEKTEIKKKKTRMAELKNKDKYSYHRLLNSDYTQKAADSSVNYLYQCREFLWST